MAARLVSVNVGSPQFLIVHHGRKLFSSIVKKSVEGFVTVRPLNLEGDSQSDLTVHGGIDKAVYAYPSEHYVYWRDRFPDLSWGSFGENFTTEGLVEENVRIGDHFSIGSAEFQITQPRFPCFKLGARFGTQKMIKFFLDSGRTGFYLRVLKEGQVRRGDDIVKVSSQNNSQTIATLVAARRKREAEKSPAIQ
jgi:MOSC domain-containing protein YiiM